ncbi:MAG: DUF234 domain-containing protein [Solirubrobacterales bacterium]|nr:DUF234 domain-containing protein [Solirubrobacterales bacterium]
MEDNLRELVCTPGRGLLAEGELVMRGEALADLERQVLFAVATGRTTWSEIRDSVKAVPTRSLDNLLDLRLIERLEPVTEAGRDVRKVRYRVADNFLAFWLGPLARYRTEINRGLGSSILPVLTESLDDFMGLRWESAVRQHLVTMANRGELGRQVVAVGPFWTARSPREEAYDQDPSEIDAVVLSGRSRVATAVCEAKWSRSVDGGAIRNTLERKAAALPRRAHELTYIVAAREQVTNRRGVLPITAHEIFG